MFVIDDDRLSIADYVSDRYEYEYGGNSDFQLYAANPFSTDKETHCYNSKFCYDNFDGEFRNFYYSNIL